MSTARVILEANGKLLRLLRVETTADGGLVVVVDRDASIKSGGMRLEEGHLQADGFRQGEVAPHGKFTCHTTGQINRWSTGRRSSVHFVEPLTRLTKRSPVGFLSIPSLDRLDEYLEAKHPSDLVAKVVPAQSSGRLTFTIELVAAGNQSAVLEPALFLNYEVYSVAITMTDYQPPPELERHFIEGSPQVGTVPKAQLEIAEAELEFYRLAHPNVPPLFREDSGAYVLLAAVSMRVPPRLRVEFSRADLSAEQIPFENRGELHHKVRFWIKDRGGKNKVDDLRREITSLALDAEFGGPVRP